MNFQSIRNESQYPGRYRQDLLVERLGKLTDSPRVIAKRAGVSHQKLYQALDGDCKKIETLWRIAKAMNLKWICLFDFELKHDDFRDAVLSRGSESKSRNGAGSSGRESASN